MPGFKYDIDNLEQRKTLVAGGSLVDIVHIDFHMENGMPQFVDLPLGAATKAQVDAAIQDKIAKVLDILSLGK
jgi:hypothetical protein